MMDTVNDDPPDWRTLLLDGKNPGRSIHDALTLLRCHPDTRGRLRYNAFAKQAIAWDWLPWQGGGLSFPRALEDADGTLATAWAETQGLHKVGVATIKDCMVTVARQRTFNPLVDWLQTQVWDGQPRINKWLSYYLGADLSPYIEAIGPKFLISAVARAFRPGCKADCMLILEGPQGRYKSTAARLLFGSEWYTDDLADLHSKDAPMQMQGKWGIEMSELASMSKAESNRTKAVLSRQVDRFRAPYDRFVMEHPRQCVFIGTTNSVDGYFKDPTGSRRFWPVACKSIEREAIINDRAQLWAEAVVRFERGEIWWLEGSEIRLAMDQQAARDESDPWEMAVTSYVAGRSVVTTSEILSNQLEMKISDQGRADEMRITAVLTKLGWWKKRVMQDGDRKWTWYCPTYQEVLSEVGQQVGQEFS